MAITVTGHLYNASGVGIPGSVVFQLVGYGNNIPRVIGTNAICPTLVTAQAASNGSFSIGITGNDTIDPGAANTPPTTYYLVSFRDQNGNVIQIVPFNFTGAGPNNLDSQAPLNPIPSPIPPPNNAALVGANNDFTGNNTFQGVTTLGDTIIGTATFNGSGSPVIEDGSGNLRGCWTTGVEDGQPNGIFQFYQEIGTTPTSVYPLGTDFNLKHRGPADFYWRASKLACTTTASLSIGANTSVLVSAVSETPAGVSGTTALLAQTAGQGLVLGRGQSNEEVLTWNASGGAGTWYVVDGTHLYLYCANTHSGTTDIEQGPGTVFATEQQIVMQTDVLKPSQVTYNPPLFFIDDIVGGKTLGLPSDLSTNAPYNGVIIGAQTPVYYLADPSYYTWPPAVWVKTSALVSAVDNIPAKTFVWSDQNGNLTGLWANPVIVAASPSSAPTTGVIRLNNGNIITWRNDANSGDLGLGANTNNMLDITTGFAGLEVASGAVITWNGDTGISRSSAGVLDFGNGSAGDASGAFKAAGFRVTPDATHVADLGFAANNILGLGATMILGWYSTAAGFTQDTGISRVSAGVLAIGNGSGGDASGTLTAGTINATSSYEANGTPGVASFSGPVTSITIVNGIVTAIS